MTTVATMVGAVPEAFALGPGSEVIRPMAIAVIGGLVVSVNLTLLVVPCIYSLMSRFESVEQRRRLREALTALGELPAGADTP